MNGIIRRRMFGVEDKNKYAFTAEATKYTPANPKVMEVLYAAGLCASPDYMTIKEASTIKNSDLRLNTWFNNANVNEPFDGFMYFTSVTTVPMTGGYSGITHIIFPPSITRIEGDAFRHSSLRGTVVIPESVTYIGVRAFYQISNALTNLVLVFNGTVPCSIGAETTFSPTSGPGALYVPDEAIEDYKEAWTYQSIIDRIKPLSEYNSN